MAMCSRWSPLARHSLPTIAGSLMPGPKLRRRTEAYQTGVYTCSHFHQRALASSKGVPRLPSGLGRHHRRAVLYPDSDPHVCRERGNQADSEVRQTCPTFPPATRDITSPNVRVRCHARWPVVSFIRSRRREKALQERIQRRRCVSSSTGWRS